MAIYILIYKSQLDAQVTEFILSDNCSTCFGRHHYPSSGAQSNCNYSVWLPLHRIVVCFYRGRVETDLTVLWMAYIVFECVVGPCIVIIFQYINPNKMYMLQSLFYLTNALHVSGVTLTHLQEHKTTVNYSICNRYTVIDKS